MSGPPSFRAMHGVAIFLQAFIAAAIFLVWGLGHRSVAEELRQEQLPNCILPSWLRDFLAILKVAGGILLLVGINRPRAAIFGALMLVVLLATAVFTHLRMKKPPAKSLLAAGLLLCSLVVAYLNYRLNFSS